MERIYFVDDTFTAEEKRLQEFIYLMKEYNPNILWACESRVDVMTTELMDDMVESGCNSIQFGIESGNQEILNQIHKNINLDHAWSNISCRAVYETRTYGLMRGK